MTSAAGLDGQNVLITRAEMRAGVACRLSQFVRAAGGCPISHPVIRLELVQPTAESTRIFADFEQFGTLVFVSANGVSFFADFARLHDCNWSERLHGMLLAAIGPGTAAELESAGLDVAVCPSAHSESLAGWLHNHAPEPYLIVRADRGNQVLSTALQAQGREFQELVVYNSKDVERPEPSVLAKLNHNQIDWVALTSSAIAASALGLFGSALRETRIVTIGPQVSKVVRSAGLEISAEAKEANFYSMVEAMSGND